LLIHGSILFLSLSLSRLIGIGSIHIGRPIDTVDRKIPTLIEEISIEFIDIAIHVFLVIEDGPSEDPTIFLYGFSLEKISSIRISEVLLTDLSEIMSFSYCFIDDTAKWLFDITDE